jgi:hypothetical protein
MDVNEIEPHLAITFVEPAGRVANHVQPPRPSSSTTGNSPSIQCSNGSTYCRYQYAGISLSCPATSPFHSVFFFFFHVGHRSTDQ